MSCSTNKSSNTPYIKIGDSFNVPIQLVDVTTGLPAEITNAMTITSRIINLLGEEIAVPTVTPYPDQILDKGFILLSVSSTITSTWEVGKAKFDVKFVVDGSTQHTQDFSFNIIGAITP